MVKTIILKVWKCPYCGDKFKTNDDCDEHLQNHLEYPEEFDEEYYYCEICKGEFTDYLKANNCEIKHKDGKDMHYQAYLDELERYKLREAGEHPSQKKLIENG